MSGYCDRGIFHSLAGYFPNGVRYEVACSCGHREQAGLLFTDPVEAIADALVKLGEHITAATLLAVT